MRVFRHLLLGFLVLLISSASFAQVGITVSFGPPALPVYEQPICPGDGYLWVPGYWAWDPDFADYYWVPGTWVLAPEVGYLWTPGWWGWGGSGFLFHDGYWGPHVGFYGGIVYGFGYFGVGFEGGRWDGGHFFYNRAVNNVNVTVIHNTYITQINNVTVNHVSYNGGQGGIDARPTAGELAAEHERHIPPVAAQEQHIQAARSNPALRASANQGRPPIAATARPAEFKTGAVAAREAGAPYHPPSGAARPANPVHASELQPHVAPAPVDSGNPKADQKYQQQQAKLIAKQNQEHQQLQQRQEADHQRATQQNADAARQQQLEQKHQQQTTQLEQRHTQQEQRVQQRAPAPRAPEERPR
jgi:hypothetical protein